MYPFLLVPPKLTFIRDTQEKRSICPESTMKKNRRTNMCCDAAKMEMIRHSYLLYTVSAFLPMSFICSMKCEKSETRNYIRTAYTMWLESENADSNEKYLYYQNDRSEFLRFSSTFIYIHTQHTYINSQV